uniref:Autophagy-related protein 101 n=1 Tax=Leersia perrieri TaxID=77586 RepID=A0A0D9XYW7_9ORYZ
MNCETCQLKELEVEPREIKDVLRCILHTIFFHRTLSLVRPKDVDCEFFEITYVQCGLPELEKEVDEKIDQFVAWVEKHPHRSSQVCLSFFDEKNKHPGWFGNKTERQALEESSSRRVALESSIHEVLFQIINFANEKKDHIPPIPDRIFNHEISIPR